MKLTIRKADLLDDWYIIECAEQPGEHREWMEPTAYGVRCQHSARFAGGADVEGTGAEMLAIAHAIKQRGHVAFKRCSVAFGPHGFRFMSPRNSLTESDDVPIDVADALAAEILTKLNAIIDTGGSK